ncbi:hypothetical protein WJX73_010521 [Symbiochloris irregularis]|uniref:Ankyrin repeat domain-containing protein n=1 Tax=Symbiochloris irregularis TaxID=706552 RepID=A0AAW1P1Z8_9CHLO
MLERQSQGLTEPRGGTSDDEWEDADSIEDDWEDAQETQGLPDGVTRPSVKAMQAAAARQPHQTPASAVSEQDTGKATTSAAEEEFPAHKAAFEGDGDLLVGLLMGLTEEQKCRKDPQGNTVLHVVALRRHLSLLQRLLVLGISPSAMKDMPDCSFKLKWELGSPVFGRLLRQFAPHDTYEVWKNGVYLRVDGSLMGLDDKSTSLIPQWKRGHFSLVFNGSTHPATLHFLDHRKQRFFDLNAERKKHASASIEAQVADLIAEGPNRTKMKALDFRFKSVKGWLGGDQTENIEGWKTKVYEATGKINAITTRKGRVTIPAGSTFEDYLTLEPEEDTVEVSPVDLQMLNPSGKGDKQEAFDLGPPGAAKKVPKQPRKMTAKCWMAANFPISMRQLIPILDIVAHANKHLGRVSSFMRKYGDMELFPVKLQIPLLWTAYAQVSFRDFSPLDVSAPAGDPNFYVVPQDYTPRTLEEVAASRNARAFQRNGSELSSEEAQLRREQQQEMRRLWGHEEDV